MRLFFLWDNKMPVILNVVKDLLRQVYRRLAKRTRSFVPQDDNSYCLFFYLHRAEPVRFLPSGRGGRGFANKCKFLLLIKSFHPPISINDTHFIDVAFSVFMKFHPAVVKRKSCWVKGGEVCSVGVGRVKI